MKYPREKSNQTVGYKNDISSINSMLPESKDPVRDRLSADSWKSWKLRKRYIIHESNTLDGENAMIAMIGSPAVVRLTADGIKGWVDGEKSNDTLRQRSSY